MVLFRKSCFQTGLSCVNFNQNLNHMYLFFSKKASLLQEHSSNAALVVAACA
jgi:hypothetical protein